MKSLDEIDAKLEKRTPISSAPVTISQSGSYYLTGNLSVTTGDAITISANGVTIDLNGFTITSTSATASGTAILLGAGVHDITIRNGHIVSGTTYTSGGGFTNGPGFLNGVRYNGSLQTVLVSGVTVTGCKGSAIDLAFNQTVVESCSVTVAGGYGITASSIKNSTAANTGLKAIFANTVAGCSGSSTDDIGIDAQSVQNSYGISNSNIGIHGYSVTNCYGQTNTGNYGILAESIAAFCSGYSASHFAVASINLAFASGGFGGVAAGHQYFCGSGPTTYP